MLRQIFDSISRAWKRKEEPRRAEPTSTKFEMAMPTKKVEAKDKEEKLTKKQKRWMFRFATRHPLRQFHFGNFSPPRFGSAKIKRIMVYGASPHSRKANA